MSKKVTQSNKTYQIRPPFKDKFRPAEAKEKIEKIVREKLKNAQYTSNELPQWTRDIADETKQELKNLGKDKRYKYLVQVIIGQNSGQGVRVGSRCFWDEDTDDCTWVSYMNDSIFCLVVAFAVYLY
eukprot:403354159